MYMVLLHARNCKPPTIRSFSQLQRDPNAFGVFYAKDTRRRLVWRRWLRGDSDKRGDLNLVMMPHTSRPGKMAGNKLHIWGATLMDFYNVQRIPTMPYAVTLSSGSKLAAFMSVLEELEYAFPELQWSRSEPDPKEVEPYPVGELIQEQEMRIRLGLCGMSGLPGDNLDGDALGEDKDDNGVGKEEIEQSIESTIIKGASCIDNDAGQEKDETRTDQDNESPIVHDEASQPEAQHEDKTGESKDKGENEIQSLIINDDVFRPDAYPAPWPLLPFSYNTPTLQQRIPLHRLPKNLIVHDPWDLLSVPTQNQDDDYSYNETRTKEDIVAGWAKKRDIVHKYNLMLFTAGRRRLEKQKQEEELCKGLERQKRRKGLIIPDVDKFAEPFDGFVVQPTSWTLHTPVEPPIYVVHDPPPEPKPVEVAHLYMDPSHVNGWGNHSMVLNTELEAPRSLFVPDILCYKCVMEDVKKTLIEQDGEDGSRKDKRWMVKSGVWRSEEVREPVDLAYVLQGEERARGFVATRRHEGIVYTGVVRPIGTNVGWQNPERGPYCEHVMEQLHAEKGKGEDKGNTATAPAPHPLTAKVQLVAKLSKQSDRHLEREALNYQEFPEHFYEHWTGYNVVEPLHHPVPVGALIPQFYGYYTPEEVLEEKIVEDNVKMASNGGRSSSGEESEEEEEEEEEERPYRSPILLLENCGKQIVLDTLTVDDKCECASLFYRLHHAGYLHHSTWERNVLIQPCPLDVPPILRGTKEYTDDKRKKACRLIDFGRTVKINRYGARAIEEFEVNNMLKALF
ncbi:hypothetical protein AMATHDRAFT_180677 [Amanita thiersii Skay4041]|uniref:Protein kinase domain-containing protein n=1 Tax=Amanita thiersii Skay4041 TaxID=703135 RepID=A0A2A9NJ72_9AGAR|nr:hypothetical protein AMATHDRAFT_180677 [Amanita thiersii Skay4041]